ncbi:MAG: serine/threonine protein kinase, partial [Planctomycetota bacterium]
MNEDDKKTTPRDHDSDEAAQEDSNPLQMVSAGKKIGRYRLIKELGQGGQGYVYLAEDEILKRKVALKVLLERARMSPESRLRFEREAEAASKLDHSGIARVYEFGEDAGLAFIAFELVQGKTLQAHISETAERASGNREITEIYFDFDNESEPHQATEPESSSSTSSADRNAIMGAVCYIESAALALHAAHESGLIH